MREKVFAGAVLIVTALLCIFMPKISSKLKPKPVFTQEFAAGVVEEVLEEDLFPDPAVRGKFRGTQLRTPTCPFCLGVHPARPSRNLVSRVSQLACIGTFISIVIGSYQDKAGRGPQKHQ